MSEIDQIKIDIEKSKLVDIKNLKSVCLILGPYRNLTTLTSSVLFLHKNCQVLNHAGGRILSNKKLNFLSEYSDEKFDTFLKYSIYISEYGRQGDYGGSITFSHAFNDKYKVKNIFNKTGLDLVKKDIECLIWKESLRVSHFIKAEKTNLLKLFETNKKLKFLLPIRNPMDCAISNHFPKHLNIYNLADKNATLEEVLSTILDEILWVIKLQKKYPDRFFIFFEFQFDQNLLANLCDFLGIENNTKWNNYAIEAFQVNKKYIHTSQFNAYYTKSIKEKFIEFPDIYKKLLKFSAPKHHLLLT